MTPRKRPVKTTELGHNYVNIRVLREDRTPVEFFRIGNDITIGVAEGEKVLLEIASAGGVVSPSMTRCDVLTSDSKNLQLDIGTDGKRTPWIHTRCCHLATVISYPIRLVPIVGGFARDENAPSESVRIFFKVVKTDGEAEKK